MFFPRLFPRLLRCALAAALGLFSVSGTRVAAQIPGIKHLVVIGCDGLGSLAFTASNAPVMHRLMREGAWTLRARGVFPTSSSPNWASMISGAGPEQHGVTSNDWQTNRFEVPALPTVPEGRFPTIFGVLHRQRPQAEIACIHDWSDFARLIEPGAASYVTNVKGSPLTAGHAIQVLKERRPIFTFIHFDDVDHAGHSFGWKSPTYFKTVDLVDSLIGDVLQGIDDAGMAGRTLVLITADHGGLGTKHGGMTIEELEIPWILHGPGVARGREITVPVNTYDTAATLAWVFGLTPPSVWIGRPVREAFSRR